MAMMAMKLDFRMLRVRACKHNNSTLSKNNAKSFRSCVNNASSDTTTKAFGEQLDIAADVVYKSKRRQHGCDRDGRRKCESRLAVVLDIFVRVGEGTERGYFLDLVIRARSLLGWTPYHQTYLW